MTRYTNDPRQITTKFSSICSKCKTEIKKGATIYYWSSSREVFCTSCGDSRYRQFLSSAADEDVLMVQVILMLGKFERRGNPLFGRRQTEDLLHIL